MSATLYSIGYSPWSAKAKWALDHHGVKYAKKAYTPFFGALPLRMRMKKWSGRVTVPVYFDDTGVYDDSLTIARRAEAIGTGATLFPAEHDEAIVHWNTVAERLSGAGRTLATMASMADPASLKASLPKNLANLPGAGLIGQFGARNFVKKYDMDSAGALAVMDEALSEMDAALTGDTLFGDLTYADIAVAVSLQFVKPVDHPSIRVGRAAIPSWTQPTLVEKYPRLLAWRDALFATYR